MGVEHIIQREWVPSSGASSPRPHPRHPRRRRKTIVHRRDGDPLSRERLADCVGLRLIEAAAKEATTVQPEESWSGNV
ncbi:hypothetical protein GCM10022198_04210 [Klugiella xanthotipulae]